MVSYMMELVTKQVALGALACCDSLERDHEWYWGNYHY